jgi:hypothetical protein
MFAALLISPLKGDFLTPTTQRLPIWFPERYCPGPVILFFSALPNKAIRMTAVTELFHKQIAGSTIDIAFCGIVSIVAGFILQMIGIWMPAFLLR